MAGDDENRGVTGTRRQRGQRAPDTPNAGGDREALAHSFLAALAEQPDELVEEVVGALVATSALGDASEEETIMVRAMAGFSATLYLTVLGERRRLRPDELTTIESGVNRLAAAGLGDDDLTARVRAGGQAALRFLGRRLDALPPHEAKTVLLTELAVLSMDFHADVSEAVARGYRRQRERAMAAETRARQELADELLDGARSSPAELRGRAATLGHDLTLPHGLVLVAAPTEGDGAGRVTRTAAGALADVPGALEGSGRAHPFSHTAVLVPASSATAWEAVLAPVEEAPPAGMVVVAARPVADLTLLAVTYRQAVACLEVAVRQGRTGLVRVEAMAAERVVAAVGSLEAYRALHPVFDRLLALPAIQRRHVVETLDALWRHGGNRKVVAPLLGLEKRGLQKRLERIRELTGLNPGEPADRWHLETACLALRVFGAT